MKAGKPLSLYVNPVVGFHVMVHLVFKKRKASIGLSVLFNQSIISYIFEQNCNVKQILYARYYNPRFVYFLPHFSVQFIIKSG